MATIIRSGQNFGVNTIFVIGGFIEDKYKGSIHKFSHQMNTQDGVASVTLLYFTELSDFLKHLPSQTTLVLVETFEGAQELKGYVHPNNATYMFGRETTGIEQEDLDEIEVFFDKLNADIPPQYLDKHEKTVHLNKIKINTPQSLNLGVCASIVMYDRHSK
ncbi:MAG: hypothetical protein KAQ91_07465 [Methylococcales bacterium]|nr:hypothetical protein [Methylococcales bacterium]